MQKNIKLRKTEINALLLLLLLLFRVLQCNFCKLLLYLQKSVLFRPNAF